MKLILASFVCMFLGGFLFWYIGPSVVADLAVDDSTLVQSSNHRIENASCRVKAFVLSTCDIDVQHSRTGEETFFNYMIFGQMAGESVYVMADPKSDYVTTNIGVDHIINRLFMLIALGGGAFFAGLKVLYMRVFTPRSHNRLRYR